MKTVSNNKETKEIIKEVLIELLSERKDIFYDLIVEAVEDIALGKAIEKGRNNKFVSEEDVMAVLEA